ncbi:fructosamine kinase family protein [Pseudoclavibacter sp. CFCC 13796]|uniref:fructosamine kinase family protein n=1 Tax=Pseudoclavibacter sp. CFCC 13796 TaxID=2615179 RepID=UPI001CE42949|nr:fructosamine kinase family protein [Pseudoclavibacter sp. CFCC 13796]
MQDLDIFLKTKRPGDNLPGEAASLRWLAEAEPDGGVHIARVFRVDETELAIERVHETMPTAASARAFGRALAHTHAAGAPWWGCPPDDWVGPSWVGHSHTPLVLDETQAAPNWGTLYADSRIEVFAERLSDRGDIDAAQRAVFDRVCDRLRAGEFDVVQPALVREAGHTVARNHGDLWGGNVMYDGGPTGVTLIDPYAQGGHAETDLASLAVFGLPLRADVVAAYDEVSPLADGWRERVGLHELAMIIMHAYKYAGGYIEAAVTLARRYC